MGYQPYTKHPLVKAARRIPAGLLCFAFCLFFLFWYPDS